jgi:uncharacterized protein
MEKLHFFYKLIPPRPNFHLDMSEKEKSVWKLHADYWKKLVEKGTAIIYGPVFDPKYVYGMAIVEATSEDEAKEIVSNDPAISSGIGTFELNSMFVGMIRLNR